MVGSPRLARISRMLSSIGHAIGENGLIRLMVVSLKWRLLRVASWASCARAKPAIRVSRRSTGRPALPLTLRRRDGVYAAPLADRFFQPGIGEEGCHASAEAGGVQTGLLVARYSLGQDQPSLFFHASASLASPNSNTSPGI